MKNWNKIGKIKAVILGFIFILNLMFPIGPHPQIGFFTSLIFPLLFGSIFVPFVGRINNTVLGREIVKPHWNDNPLSFKQPLAFNQFFAYLLIITGLSMILGSAIKFHLFHHFGLASISFGVGILIGNHLALKRKANSNK